MKKLKLTNNDIIHFDIYLPSTSKVKKHSKKLPNIHSIKDLQINYTKAKQLAKCSKGKLSIKLEQAKGKEIDLTLTQLKNLFKK